jgi:NADH dehydrogenase/NADH:ubiquinone oxidoreductase subunit G
MRGSERGFVAIEWVAAIAMLLLPIVVLVATMPQWAERKHAATVAAREAARDLVSNWPNGNPAAAVLVAVDVAGDHGVDAADVDVRVRSVGETRGSQVEVEVKITMPALGVGRMSVGSWHYTAHATRRIDDYRSR